MSEEVFVVGGTRITVIRIPDDDHRKPQQPKPAQAVVAKPGSHWAAEAAKRGREDEYIDAMNGRYGGEW